MILDATTKSLEIDLALTAAGDNGKRRLLIEATYSSTEGSNLPLKKEYAFTVSGIIAVT